MPATKQQIRQIIADNNLKSVADVYSLLRDSFKDILPELMEAELDSFLGYEKNQKGDVITSNKRNGHSPKTEHLFRHICDPCSPITQEHGFFNRHTHCVMRIGINAF